jgi:hypothetical protein
MATASRAMMRVSKMVEGNSFSKPLYQAASRINQLTSSSAASYTHKLNGISNLLLRVSARSLSHCVSMRSGWLGRTGQSPQLERRSSSLSKTSTIADEIPLRRRIGRATLARPRIISSIDSGESG